MTTRPPQPGPRPPQRTLSGSGMLQRQAQQQRFLQQQSQLSSPGWPIPNVVDLTGDGGDTLGPRQDMPRLATSGLRTEVAMDAKDALSSPAASPTASPAPKGLTAHSQPRGKPAFLVGRETPFSATGGPSTFSGAPTLLEKASTQSKMPFPRRPPNFIPQHTRPKVSETRGPLKKDTRPKPYVLEVPNIAPKYGANGHADFYPWTGNHPEDIWSDSVVRQGYYDKSNISQNETLSAKQTLYPTLRQKNGLQNLGSLFSHVLAQRRVSGQIVTPPTFKPPPRVTLTDTKRESWLRDLANPTIPLRKLSRTIPHGVRGKVLLEQCTNKAVPIERAVWLAKCVGANEIRATKRKGVSGSIIGGETKWIRDWTVFVEQYLETIINACGEQNWRTRVHYAVRLSATLYNELLLDSEHFLEWIVVSLENSPSTRLPMWLLLFGVYREDLMRYRKYARKVVAAITSHFLKFNNDPNQDLCAPLLDRLTSTLNTLLEESPESFIASKSWTQLRETLASNTDAVGVAYSQRLASIENRNQHLHHQCTNVDGTSSRTKLIACLDMAYQRPFCSELSKDCLAIAGLDPSLCLTIIDWATSFHRPGLAKIYIGARLLRLCGRRGMNVTEVTLNFVAAKSGSKSTCKASVYHLISELVRSGHFSISVYMQWLIARGGFRGVEDVAVDGPCATRLLAELPLANLPGDMERLRSTLLGRIHYSLESEETSIDECWAVVQNTVPTLFGEASDAMAVSVIGNSPLSLSDQSRTVKAEIGWQLRHQVQQHVLNTPGGEHTTPSTAKSEGRISAMTSDELYQVHNILEQTDDIAMLADILKIVSTSQETHVLGAVADILNLHLEEFAAIGALMDLTGILIARQRALALLDRPDSLMLLASLCELLARIPGAENDHNQLSQELVRASRKAAMDACSPVSDHVAEVLQKSEGQFSDEVEQCLASGTSMDMATMEHIFQVLIERLEASWAKPSSGSDRYDVLLSRLRSFDAKNFDSLLVPWVVQTLQIHDRPSMSSMLDPLISTACLGFKEVLDIIKRTLLDNQRVKNIHYYEETLDLVLGTSSEARIMSFGDNCRLRTKRHQLQRSEHDTILSILRETLELTQTGSGGSTATFSSITAHHGSRLTNLLLTYCLTRPESVDNVLVIPLTKSGTTTCYRQLNALLQSILGNKNSPNVTLDTSPASQASEILSTASDFTLPICKLAMRCVMLYHAQSTAVEAEEGEVADPGENDLFVAFETAVEHALQRNDTTWVHIVRDLGPEVTYFLHERSETAFMALLPSLKGKATASGSQGAVESADKLLFIIRATEPSITNNKGAGETVHILERLLDFVQLADSPTGADVVTQWLPVILKYLSTYLRGLEGTKHVQEIRGRILLGLSSLLLLLQGKLGLGQFAQQTFDTMLMLVDDLSEEARHQCVAFLSAKARSGPHVSQPLAVATPPTSGFTSIPISPLPTTPSTPGVSSLAATAPTSAAADPALRYTFSFGSAKGRLREEERLLLIQKNGARLFQFKRWENLSEPTPQVGENDTALGLNLFAARKFN